MFDEFFGQSAVASHSATLVTFQKYDAASTVSACSKFIKQTLCREGIWWRAACMRFQRDSEYAHQFFSFAFHNIVKSDSLFGVPFRTAGNRPKQRHGAVFFGDEEGLGVADCRRSDVQERL